MAQPTQIMNKSSFSTKIPSRWRLAARLALLFLIILTVGKTIIGAPVEFAQMNKPCLDTEKVCSQDDYLTPQQIELLENAGLTLSDYVLIKLSLFIFSVVVFVGIGLLIFVMRPNDWMALIASGMLIVFTSAGLETEIRAAYPVLGDAADLIFNIGNILIFLFIGLFPSGRFSPRWMRWYWLGMIVITILPVSDSLKNTQVSDVVISVFWLTFLILGPFSQIYRYRNESTAIERQQTKWVVVGFGGMAGGVLVLAILDLLQGSARNSLSTILQNGFLFDVAGLLLPLGIGISVLRYRLWDVDVLIRKTLVYTLLTGLLGLTYFGVVALLQGTVTTDRGELSPAIIVATTLAIYVLFNPLRRRIQDFIDRRFYRQKYDAEKALDEFAAAARMEADLPQISSHLASLVNETLKPEKVSLWLPTTEPSPRDTNL